MHFRYRNINDAWYGLVGGIHSGAIQTIKTDSRNGPVLQIPEPVIITYSHPRERVLLNKARDANPFFHVFEAIWMLAGRNDVEPLAFYASNMRNYSDDEKTFNGAYGYRWRHGWGPYDDTESYGYCVDQLNILIDHFKRLPDSRRGVLQMWNIEDDLLRIGSDLDFMQGKESKDVCCNTCIYFSIREETCIQTKLGPGITVGPASKYLDMAVCNRSNDLVWGALGANYVHFGFLQEYMADCIGVKVGVYNQFSNNLHVYQNNWKPEEWLAEIEHAYCYPGDGLWNGSLVVDKKMFDYECRYLTTNYHTENLSTVPFSEPWIREVALPMCLAFAAHKRRNYHAALLTYMNMVEAVDWRRAGTEWIERRRVGWLAKGTKQAAHLSSN